MSLNNCFFVLQYSNVAINVVIFMIFAFVLIFFLHAYEFTRFEKIKLMIGLANKDNEQKMKIGFNSCVERMKSINTEPCHTIQIKINNH